MLVMDYALPGKRKSKNDKKAKGRYSKYKRGGKYRSTDIVESNKGLGDEVKGKKKKGKGKKR